jgi:hypothetical protein
MFASKIAKAQTKGTASLPNGLATQRATLANATV